jgi:hypothetical protein
MTAVGKETDVTVILEIELPLTDSDVSQEFRYTHTQRFPHFNGEIGLYNVL